MCKVASALTSRSRTNDPEGSHLDMAQVKGQSAFSGGGSGPEGLEGSVPNSSADKAGPLTASTGILESG